MEAVILEAKKRDMLKKEACKKYRRQGLIPSIIYGQNNNINILVDSNIFKKLTHKITKSTILNIKLEDKNYDVLIKDYEKDYLKGDFLHIDFYELQKGKLAHFRIPLNFVGNAIGVREGGIFERHMVEIEVECLPKDIVSSIDVDIVDLKVNDSLYVRDIKLDPTNYKILSHLDEVIAHVSGKKAEEEEVKEAALVPEEVAAEAEADKSTEAKDSKAKE